jgi:hypothetical protein
MPVRLEAWAGCCLAGLFVARGAAASPASTKEGQGILPEPSQGSYVHTFSVLGYGRGLRLNNPYRLATPLGKDERSLSLSASYLDLGLGATLGDPNGLQHGLMLRCALALAGIAQEVVAPGYIALYQLQSRGLLFGRLALPIVTRPDPNVGVEAGVGGAFFLQAAWGLYAEGSFSRFYGAAIRERAATPVGVLAGQLGLWAEVEVLP